MSATGSTPSAPPPITPAEPPAGRCRCAAWPPASAQPSQTNWAVRYGRSGHARSARSRSTSRPLEWPRLRQLQGHNPEHVTGHRRGRRPVPTAPRSTKPACRLTSLEPAFGAAVPAIAGRFAVHRSRRVRTSAQPNAPRTHSFAPASMMTCTFAENRCLREDAPVFRSRTGIRVPSTIHSRSRASAGRAAGSIASSGRSRWITGTPLPAHDLHQRPRRSRDRHPRPGLDPV